MDVNKFLADHPRRPFSRTSSGRPQKTVEETLQEKIKNLAAAGEYAALMRTLQSVNEPSQPQPQPMDQFASMANALKMIGVDIGGMSAQHRAELAQMFDREQKLEQDNKRLHDENLVTQFSSQLMSEVSGLKNTLSTIQQQSQQPQRNDTLTELFAEYIKHQLFDSKKNSDRPQGIAGQVQELSDTVQSMESLKSLLAPQAAPMFDPRTADLELTKFWLTNQRESERDKMEMESRGQVGKALSALSEWLAKNVDRDTLKDIIPRRTKQQPPSQASATALNLGSVHMPPADTAPPAVKSVLIKCPTDKCDHVIEVFPGQGEIFCPHCQKTHNLDDYRIAEEGDGTE